MSSNVDSDYSSDMNEEQKKPELSIPGLNAFSLTSAMHAGDGVPSPFMRDIYLKRQVIVGMRYQGGAASLLKELKEGDKITFLREPENRYDKKAVVALDRKGRKLGYIPRAENEIPAALMDAGKVLYGLVSKRQVPVEEDAVPSVVFVELYLREFSLRDEMNEIPRQGYYASYAVCDLKICPKEAWAVREIHILKVIHGEERGFLERCLTEDAEENDYRMLLCDLDRFIGFLPVVVHGLSSVRRKSLEEAYGVFLGKPFSNHLIDTREMAGNHFPHAESYSLSGLSKHLKIRHQGKNGGENRCRKILTLYRIMDTGA